MLYPLIERLSQKYDGVATNPLYMGVQRIGARLKAYAQHPR